LSWEGIDKDEQPDLTTGTDGDTGNPEGWFWWTADGTGEPTSGDWFLDPEVWNLYDRLVIVLKAGPGFSGFELESDDLTGTWNLLEAALSHASLYGVRADTPPPPNGVPEPGTLALLGLGLAGMGALRRRRA
jgi:hypothetical protein